MTSQLAQYAVQVVVFSVLVVLAVWGCRVLFVKDDTDAPTIAEMKRKSWR